MPDKEKFWVKKPCVLATEPYIFPSPDMTKTQKLNALTRLSIVAAGIMYFMDFKYWYLFALIVIILIILLNFNTKGEKEKFSIVPTYVGTDFQQTVVAPTFAEEWHDPPPAYDIFTQVPLQGDAKSTFETPMQPQSYPYGQVLSRTNLLPSDEFYTHLGCGGAKTAREYINSTYTRHDLAHRENMMRIYKKKLNRRFRHNVADTFSPYHSY